LQVRARKRKQITDFFFFTTLGQQNTPEKGCEEKRTVVEHGVLVVVLVLGSSAVSRVLFCEV
jgi:hypothetical protein